MYAVGPVPMMRAVSEQTRPYAIPTTVSLNAIMVDGTGMCGGCRVSIGGQSRYACVDGPEFDAHTVDFQQLADRLTTYRSFEQAALERREACRIPALATAAAERPSRSPTERPDDRRTIDPQPSDTEPSPGPSSPARSSPANRSRSVPATACCSTA